MFLGDNACLLGPPVARPLAGLNKECAVFVYVNYPLMYIYISIVHLLMHADYFARLIDTHNVLYHIVMTRL